MKTPKIIRIKAYKKCRELHPGGRAKYTATPRFICMSDMGIVIKWNTRDQMPMSMFEQEAKRYLWDCVECGQHWWCCVRFKSDPLYSKEDRHYFQVVFTNDELAANMEFVRESKVWNNQVGVLTFKIKHCKSYQSVVNVLEHFIEDYVRDVRCKSRKRFQPISRRDEHNTKTRRLLLVLRRKLRRSSMRWVFPGNTNPLSYLGYQLSKLNTTDPISA